MTAINTKPMMYNQAFAYTPQIQNVNPDGILQLSGGVKVQNVDSVDSKMSIAEADQKFAEFKKKLLEIAKTKSFEDRIIVETFVNMLPRTAAEYEEAMKDKTTADKVAAVAKIVGEDIFNFLTGMEQQVVALGTWVITKVSGAFNKLFG